MTDGNTTTRALVDWMSYSPPIPEALRAMSVLQRSRMDLELSKWAWARTPLGVPKTVKRRPARHPFRWMEEEQMTGARIQMHGRDEFVHITLPGRACGAMSPLKIMDTCRQHHGTFSRVDVALDIKHEAETVEDIKALATAIQSSTTNGRIKTFSEMTSQSGFTCYVGSWHSVTFARIYQYLPPHHRSGWLRIEVRLNNHLADWCAHLIHTEGLWSAIKSALDKFQFAHPLVVRALTERDGTIDKAPPPLRRNGTIDWLHSAVLSSVRRMLEAGYREEMEQWRSELNRIFDDD